MIFLGTASAWGIPSAFCNCDVCNYARKNKGKDVRTRCSFMLDENILIDFGPDHVVQSVNNDLDFTKIEHILFTHTHNDHLCSDIFFEKCFIPGQTGKGLNIYLVEEGYKYITDFYPLLDSGYLERFDSKHTIAHKQSFYETLKIKDYEITAFKGHHSTPLESVSANYLIKRNNHTLYYATDSGFFLEETFEHLKDKHLDIYIGELTYPTLEDKVTEASEHMDIKRFLKNLDVLYKNKTIDEHTKIYATHLSCYNMNHKQIGSYFNSLDLPYHIEVAYDGLEIDNL